MNTLSQSSPTTATAASEGEGSPERHTVFVLGFFVLVGAASSAISSVNSEQREWLAYMVASLAAPLVALAPSRLVAGWLGRLLLGSAGLYVAAGLFVQCFRRMLPYGSELRAGLLALAVAVLSLAVVGLGALLLNRTGDREQLDGDEHPRRWWGWLFAALSVHAALLLMGRTAFWFDRRIGIALAILAAMSWLTWRAWSGPSFPLAKVPGRMIDVAWGLILLLGTLNPLYPPGDYAMIHWSFYQGPISLVQQGGVLLWDTPSQYGFLSILLPALLPFEDAASGMHVVHAALLFGAAAIIYRLLLGIRDGFLFRIWAGLLALTAVYLYPGDMESFSGPWGCPSAGCYRFFWVFALAVFLATDRMPGSLRSLPQQVLGTSVLVILGALWSVESAVYVIGTLGVAAVAEMAILTATGGWRRDGLGWSLRYLGPGAGLAATLLLITGFYQLQFGVGPDWRAYVEYAASYSGGFGGLPIDSFGGILYLALAAAAAGTCAARSAAVERSPAAASLFAPYGAMIGTLSYFISRSHEFNASNIAALWIGLLVVLLRVMTARRDEAFAGILRMLILPTSVVMLATVCCLEPAGRARIMSFTKQLPASTMEHAFAQRFDVNFALLPTIRTAIGDLPINNISGYYPYTNLPALPNEPWLPIASREEFFILSPERQERYLERFLDRHKTPVGYLFRRDVPPWDPPDWLPMHEKMLKTVDAVLPRFYRLTETIPLGDDYRLERWERR